jgi:sugar diacid utilization regulator
VADDVIIISLCDARVHVQSSVNAYIALGQEYFLCLFHKEKAILDLARAKRVEENAEKNHANRTKHAKKRQQAKRVRVVAAARQRGIGQIQLSLSSVRSAAVAGVRKALVSVPTVSAFMARAQTAAGKLFTF